MKSSVAEYNLSDREKIMFDVLTDKRRKQVSVDQLMKALRKKRQKIRGGSRSLTVCVRYLGYKIAPMGYAIERVSTLGRGNKALYELRRINGRKRQ